MDTSGFIVPPPGLIPARRDETAAPAAPIAAPFPVFVPTPLGAARAADAAWRLTAADGQELGLTGALVFGRSPSPVALRPLATLVPVVDAAKSVSKTHAVVDVDGTGLAVTDLHSTNGVSVIHPDGTRTDLEPGGRAVLTDGCTLRLGEFAIGVRRA